MPIPTNDEFRTEFHALKKRQAELEAALAPLRDAYEAARELERQFVEENVKPHQDAMAPVTEELHQVNSQIGRIVKFLRNSEGIAQTGEAAA